MDTPWGFFDWKDLYEERKYFVQTTLSDSPNTRSLMNRIVYCASCAAATRIETHCMQYLKEIITRFQADNADKEPDECDWLEFVFHYSEQGPLKQRFLEDKLLKEDLGLTLEETAEAVSATITQQYNILLNSRTKATWSWR
jgi:hypothetical protein